MKNLKFINIIIQWKIILVLLCFATGMGLFLVYTDILKTDFLGNYIILSFSLIAMFSWLLSFFKIISIYKKIKNKDFLLNFCLLITPYGIPILGCISIFLFYDFYALYNICTMGISAFLGQVVSIFLSSACRVGKDIDFL